jgi:2-oxoglutarate dehydrogenase complex dehydrogenase (E1) component-like enzyme
LTAHDNIQIVPAQHAGANVSCAAPTSGAALSQAIDSVYPKSLLEASGRVSPWQNWLKGNSIPVLDDATNFAPEKMKRLVFCSGRIYYDLARARRKGDLNISR